MGYFFDDDQIKRFWCVVGIFITVLFVQTSESTFTCNPQICEVSNKNMFDVPIYKKKVKINQIERFETHEYYSRFEGGKSNRRRKTIYAVPKYGKPYRFMGSSTVAEDNEIKHTLKKLNDLIPTTQDKIDVEIVF